MLMKEIQNQILKNNALRLTLLLFGLLLLVSSAKKNSIEKELYNAKIKSEYYLNKKDRERCNIYINNLYHEFENSKHNVFKLIALGKDIEDLEDNYNLNLPNPIQLETNYKLDEDSINNYRNINSRKKLTIEESFQNYIANR